MTTIDTLTVKIPADLKQKIIEAAENNKNSIDIEVIERLELSFEKPNELRYLASRLQSQIDDLRDRSDERDRKLEEIYSAIKTNGA